MRNLASLLVILFVLNKAVCAEQPSPLTIESGRLTVDGVANNSDQIIHIPGIKFPCRVDVPLVNRPEGKPLPLSLQDCLTRAMTHNLDVQITGYEPPISMADVTSAEAAFDSVLFGSSSYENTDDADLQSGFYTRTVTVPGGTETYKFPTDPYEEIHNVNYTAGLRKKLPTGAAIQLSESFQRYHDLNQDAYYYNPYYRSTLNLELRQPLLRDFGIDVNRASINAAKNRFKISQQEFQRQVIQTASQVETNYWRLVMARLQVIVYANQLQEGELALGRLLYREVLDASSETIARSRGLIERARANLTSAKNAVIQQQEQLLDSIDDPSLSMTEPWEIIPLTPPITVPYDFDRQEAIRSGLLLRPELAAQRLQVDTRKLALGVAENQVLPKLDLVAQQRVTGTDLNSSESWDRQWGNDTLSYLLGVNFELPIGNRAAESDRSKAKHQLQQEILRLKNFERQVAADVNVSLTALESAKDELSMRQRAAQAEADIISTYEAIEKAQATIDAGFLDRKIESFDRLTAVQLQLASTLNDYNIAIIDLHRAKGTLLRHNNVKIGEISQP